MLFDSGKKVILACESIPIPFSIVSGQQAMHDNYLMTRDANFHQIFSWSKFQ